MDLRLKTLVQNIYRTLLALESESSKISLRNLSIVKVNDDELSRRGDLCFFSNLKAWRIPIESVRAFESDCENILEYYLRRTGIGYNNEEIIRMAFESLTKISSTWPIRINRCSLQRERVCIFLNRSATCAGVIARVLFEGERYGKFGLKKERYSLSVLQDLESELTNLRLHLLKAVSANIINAHGYQISDNEDTEQYEVTIRSDRDCKKLLCGVVRNSVTKAKDTITTEAEYRAKISMDICGSMKHKFSSTDYNDQKRSSLSDRITNAVIAFELLSVQPNRAVVIDSNSTRSEGTTNGKGSAFVLYNTARISAILHKFDAEYAKGNYPNIPPINDIDFSLLNEEEEWELVFNYLLGYPEMMEILMKSEPQLETCPQHICSFLSRMYSKFSAYYRRVRILTEGRDHLLGTTMARLYLLKSIQIVSNNALALLNIEPVERM